MSHILFKELLVQLHHIYSEDECKGIFSILIEEITGKQLSIFLSDDKSNQLTQEQRSLWDNIVVQLKEGCPLQYIIQKQYFCGLPFQVTPDVLIPRPETEELIEWIVSSLSPLHTRSILDIGTGSGCIAILLKKYFPDAYVEAWDISAEALEVAKENANRLGYAVTFNQVDLFAVNTPDASFDLIVSNPPYIPESEKLLMHTNVRDYEPSQALFVPNEAPIIYYEQIAQLSEQMLRKKGRLFFETHYQYANAVGDMLRNKGFQEVKVMIDISGNPRMVCATKQ